MRRSRASTGGGPPLRSPAGSLGAKLFAVLLTILILVFAIFAVVITRIHRRDLEASTFQAAERVTDLIQRTMTYSMLRNDRDALRQVVDTIGREPGIETIRIVNAEGRVSFSSRLEEVGTLIPPTSPECSGCHSQGLTHPRLDSEEKFRIVDGSTYRTLGVVTPIFNAPSCSEADCHAHPASQRVLGMLDTNLSLEAADEALRSGMGDIVGYSVIAVLVVAALSGLFVWLFVVKRIRPLTGATVRLARGELGYQVPVRGTDELADLGRSFNAMSHQLGEAREEITAWTRTLEDRVEEKTRELRGAHEQMMQAEKMSSLGKMAAVVAHEINNPLSGILTYARLVRRWMGSSATAEMHRDEASEALMLIESESRRCGEIVRNLLSFSRVTPIHLTAVELGPVIDQSCRLLAHKFELSGIALRCEIEPGLAPVHGDAAQLEQLLLALMMNAAEAMPDGGNLTITARSFEEGSIRLSIEDDGVGIPEDLLQQVFEPFMTTKETTGGVGLGLAISKGIVERHRGTIEVDSQVGRGTRFTITLPAARVAQPAGAGGNRGDHG